MEATSLLEELLSEESLDNLIQKTARLQTLNILLKIKLRRIDAGQCEKLLFPINIFNDSTDLDLGISILKTALLVGRDPRHFLKQAENYCFSKISSCKHGELHYAFSVFNCVFEHYMHKNIQIKFTQGEEDLFFEGILSVLRGNSRPLIVFTLITLLPNYLGVTTKKSGHVLLKKIFDNVKESKNLDILCISFDKFISSDLNNDCFNLIKFDEYWSFLIDCIAVESSSLQKQATFLVSKSLDIVLQYPEFLPLSEYLFTENTEEPEIVWRNYLTLLDVANEKQLHIIEPALSMFSTVLKLNVKWRLCLYKMYLRHSQSAVVYYVASFILENEAEWSDLSEVVEELLLAVNKNEYSTASRGVFRKIGDICTRLNAEQFNSLLGESLKVPWIPASIWGFVSNIFTLPTNFPVDTSLMEEMLARLASVAQRFVREWCTRLVLNYFARNYTFRSIEKLLRDAHVLGQLDSELFGDFLKHNMGRIRPFIADLQNEFVKTLKNDFQLRHHREIIMKTLHGFQIDMLEIINSNSVSTAKKDSAFSCLLDLHCNPCDLENYILERINNVTDDEDASGLLSLSQRCCSEKVIKMAFCIIMDDSKYNDVQRSIAFNVIARQTSRNPQPVVHLLRSSFFKKPHAHDAKFSESLIAIILKYLANTSNAETENFIDILEHALDSEGEEVHAIFGNVSSFSKNIDRPKVFRFAVKCLDKFLILCKSRVANHEMFLSQLFMCDSLRNAEFRGRIFNFSKSLLSLATSSNALAYFLSKQIARLTEQNPHFGSVFIPVVVELMLYGILVSKSEKVEYYVCQEISSMLRLTKNNPNCRELATRLWALDSMMSLVSLPENEETVNSFVSLLLEKYNQNFSKRYFPNSQNTRSHLVLLSKTQTLLVTRAGIAVGVCSAVVKNSDDSRVRSLLIVDAIHIQKLRIVQALLLLAGFVKSQKNKIIEFIIDSFLQESHQPSVKHLMQWLLILLSRNDRSVIALISEKLKALDNNRPSSVSGLMPVVYHLSTYEKESDWDKAVALFLPYTMGAHFKLRIFSQIALVKLYEKARKKRFSDFLKKYSFLYNSLEQTVRATSYVQYDVTTVHNEFLDYFDLRTCDCSTVFYTIPKSNGVTPIEWENLDKVSDTSAMKRVKFSHTFEETADVAESKKGHDQPVVNIQKKITPWKCMLESLDSTSGTKDFVLVTSLIEKAANLGGLSRTCEVFGIKQMVMRTSKITSDKEFKSLSMSSENWVDIWEVKFEDLRAFLADVKRQGYTVIGAEQTAESVKLNEFRFPKMTALLLGNEKEGISPDLIPLLDQCLEIPQFGMVRSLNVHVAGAIMMWEYCKQHKL